MFERGLMRLVSGEGLTFDDVLLVPQYTTLNSRHEPDVSAKIENYNFRIPVIAAPMDKVCGPEMCIALGRLGGLGILHRFMDIGDQVRGAEKIKSEDLVTACALGYKDLDERTRALLPFADILLLDVANGHTEHMNEAIMFLRQFEKPIIAGNIATAEAARDYNKWGVDVYRVGIGPGAFCQTRSVTGCGIPQLTAIDYVRSATDRTIIADGGITKSGDITKALAAGANFVMLGNLLAGTEETPGDVFVDERGQKYKVCRGMASREANGRTDVAGEGITIKVPYKGPVESLINDLVMGLKSGMSYMGARDIDELQRNALFIKITSNGRYESADRIKRGS